EMKRPGFMTFYLASLDHAEHQFGPFSREAAVVLEQIDELIGTLRKAAGPGVVFTVVSDHGFVPTTKDVNLLIKFREAKLIDIDDSGHVKSWRAAGWASGASGAVVIHPKDDSGAGRDAESILGRASQDPDSGVDQILDSTEIERRGGCR